MSSTTPRPSRKRTSSSSHTPSPAVKTAPTLADLRSELILSRKKRARQVNQSEEEGWELIEGKVHSFFLPSIPIGQEYLRLDILPRTTKGQIFLRLFSPTVASSILERLQVTTPTFFLRGNGRQFLYPLSTIYQYLAIYLRILANITPLPSSSTNKRPLRAAFQLAQAHFSSNFSQPPPGIDQLTKLQGHFHISFPEEELLNSALQTPVVSLGEWVAGDEKLFHFTGQSAFLRLCPKKPDRIGFWNYELCGRLSNGKPYLLFLRTHNSEASINKSIPTSDVLRQWGEILNGANSLHTTLVADSYYLDTTARSILKDMGVHYLCAIKENRFSNVTSLLSSHVTKPGEWAAAWNTDQQEMAVHAWDSNSNIGKRWVISSAYKRVVKTRKTYYKLAYDDYKLMFALCDKFNQALHDHTLSHRSGGSSVTGEEGRLHTFYMGCIIQNVLNAFQDKQGISAADFNFSVQVAELADEVYQLASTINV